MTKLHVRTKCIGTLYRTQLQAHVSSTSGAFIWQHIKVVRCQLKILKSVLPLGQAFYNWTFLSNSCARQSNERGDPNNLIHQTCDRAQLDCSHVVVYGTGRAPYSTSPLRKAHQCTATRFQERILPNEHSTMEVSMLKHVESFAEIFRNQGVAIREC